MFLLLQADCFTGFVEPTEMLILHYSTEGLEGGRMVRLVPVAVEICQS